MVDRFLEIEDLSFSYDDRLVLANVSLALDRGEMLGLIGPNGSGKSTIIRAISRVVTPERGRIFLEGKDVTQLRHVDLAKKMAVVSQNPSLPEAFTVLEIVMMGRTPHLRLWESETARDWKMAGWAMAATGILDLVRSRVGELSGGERQRVVIARALAQEPSMLLLDEPTSHLDISHQVTILDLVRALHRKRGLAVIAVFHDLNLAAQYCQRLVLLSQGRVYAQGKPEEVITSANIRAVYGAEVQVFPHPINGLPAVLVTGDGGGQGSEKGAIRGE